MEYLYIRIEVVGVDNQKQIKVWKLKMLLLFNGSLKYVEVFCLLTMYTVSNRLLVLF